MDVLTTLTLQHLFESVKASLERLKLDYIDLLQCELLCVWHQSVCQ